MIDALNSIYAEIATRISQIGPVCEMSGRCCRFDEYGHRLYVTTAELAAFIATARQRPVPADLLARDDDAGCRFQHNRLCAVHQIRPLGCRMFYCDPRTEPELQALFEEYHARVKRLHEQFDVPYYYMEWRTALAAIAPLLTPRGDCPTAKRAIAE